MFKNKNRSNIFRKQKMQKQTDSCESVFKVQVLSIAFQQQRHL